MKMRESTKKEAKIKAFQEFLMKWYTKSELAYMMAVAEYDEGKI